MKVNIGKIDMIIRIIVGILIIASGFYFQSWFGAFGAIPLLTGIFRRCPAYPIFGINTCPSSKQKK